MVSRFARGALVVVALLAAHPLFFQAAAVAQEAPPSISAEAGVLVDSTDRTVLWEKNAHERRSPASTTKILTALIVIEKARPASFVTISRNAEEVGEGEDGPNPTVQLNLVAGERQTVRDLLFGLMLESANDAAVALAEHVAGSVSRFSDLMNEKAAAVGAKESHFVNPHGLEEQDHYSTAFDLMLLGREAMKNPLFRDIVDTTSYLFPGFGSRPAQMIENRNKLLGSYEGADGIKTGFTTPAGRAIVASAHRSAESRIAVVLGSPTDAQQDAASLLDYGFGSFSRVELVRSGLAWGHATLGDGETFVIVPGEGLVLLVRNESKPKTTVDLDAGTLTVTTDLHGRRVVPVAFHCARKNLCHSGESKDNLVLRAWRYLAPVARVLSIIW
jgi:D-alanyl-D-alanine carboxypeptidase (penicillin-binding protein 5/6)